MFFQVYQPPVELEPHIRSFWILEHEEVPEKPEIVIPDGCMELIFHYADAYKTDIKNINDPQPLTLLVGQIKKAINLQPTGKTGMISVRFNPWGFYTLTGIHASKYTNTYVDSEEVFGPVIPELKEKLKVSTCEQKIQLIAGFLLSVLKSQKQNYHRKNGHYIASLESLAAENGNTPIADLAATCNVSVRQYNRVINHMTGLPPKHYARIVRLHSFLNTYNSESRITLTNALYTSGYYDQAHFIKEFKDITSYAPFEFFRGNNEMAELMMQ